MHYFIYNFLINTLKIIAMQITKLHLRYKNLFQLKPYVTAIKVDNYFMVQKE